jgi:hypothetical protein
MKWVKRLLILAILAAAGWLVWSFLFPSPEKVIRKRIEELAVAASFGANEGELAIVNNAGKVAGFFTRDVEILVDVRGYQSRMLSGRDQLFQTATAMRSRLRGLSVEFLDVLVSLGPNRRIATVSLTAKASVPGDRDFMVQELEFTMVREGRDWLIRRVKTVRVLG